MSMPKIAMISPVRSPMTLAVVPPLLENRIQGS